MTDPDLMIIVEMTMMVTKASVSEGIIMKKGRTEHGRRDDQYDEHV